jgi:hypothetical protein
MKQETLEEAAERAVKSGLFKDETLFIAGAKWQAERMYNKEKVDKLLDTLIQNNMCSTRGDELIEEFKINKMTQTAVEWLVEQLKINNYISDNAHWLIDEAKDFEKQIVNTSKVSRIEVIQHSLPYNGRAYTNYNAEYVDIQLQDDGTTLKIFLK